MIFFSLSKAWTDKCEWASWGWMESWEKLRWILRIPTTPWRSHQQPSFIHSAFSPWMEHKKLGLMTKTFFLHPSLHDHILILFFFFFFELESETTNFICIQKDQVSIVSRILRWLKNVRSRKKKMTMEVILSVIYNFCLTCFVILYYYFTGIVWKVL